MPIVKPKWWIDSIKRDLKKLWIEESEYIALLNEITKKSYTSLSEISFDTIDRLVDITRNLVLHISSLNTIVSQIWVDKIDADFEFSTKNTDNFSSKLASNYQISSQDVISYVRDRKWYVIWLLKPKDKKAA